MRLATTIILFVLSLAWLAPATGIYGATSAQNSTAQGATTQTTVITQTVTTQTVTTQTVTTQTTTTQGTTSLPGVEVVLGDDDLVGSAITPLEPNGPCAEPSSEGPLFPSIGDNGYYGYVNRGGEIVIEPRYILAGEFSGGVAAVSLDGESFGYVDGRGNEVIPAQFADAGAFSQGLAAVRSGDPAHEYLYFTGVDEIPVQLAGVIDCEGNFVIEPEYFHVEAYRNGLAKAFTERETSVYLDLDGNQVSSEIYEFGTNRTIVYRNQIWLPEEERRGSCEPSTAIREHPSLFRCTVEANVYEPCILREDGESIVCGYPVEPFIAETVQPIDVTGVEDIRIENLWIDLLDERSCTLLAVPLQIADEGWMDANYSCTDGSYIRGEPRQFPGRELQFAENVRLSNDAPATVTESSLVPVIGLQSFDSSTPLEEPAQGQALPPMFSQAYWQLR